MKHRSPLVTLAAVAVAFAIMFTVNMLSGPPGNSSTGTAGPSSAAPAPASASSVSSQPTESAVASPSPSASQTTEESKFLQKVVYAGRTKDGSAAIAVAVLGDQSAAYFCDGRNIESWFRGAVGGADTSLKSKSGVAGQSRRRSHEGLGADQEGHTEVRDQ